MAVAGDQQSHLSPSVGGIQIPDPTDHSGKSAIKGNYLAASQNWGTAWAQGLAVNTQAEVLSVCICLHFVDSSFEKSVR